MESTPSPDDVDPFALERLVADLWDTLGWETTVTENTADGGYDVKACRSQPVEQAHLIEVKRRAQGTPIGRPKIQQFAGVVAQQGADKGVFVTTSSFTDPASTAAEQLNIGLVDREQFLELIDRHGLENELARLAEHYSELPIPDATANEARKTEVRAELNLLTQRQHGHVGMRIKGQRSLQVASNGAWTVTTGTEAETERLAAFKPDRFHVDVHGDSGATLTSDSWPDDPDIWLEYQLKHIEDLLDEVFDADWKAITDIRREY